MFIRTKKIGKYSYGYLVENQQTIKGSRQKVKGYFGRVFNFDVVKNLKFFDFYEIENLKKYSEKNKEDILEDLIKLELINAGFNKNFINQKIKFDNFKMTRGKKSVVVVVNEGFLCEFTFKRILEFKKTGNFEKDAYLLAKYFVEAGIQIPQEVFICFYEKCQNKK